MQNRRFHLIRTFVLTNKSLVLLLVALIFTLALFYLPKISEMFYGYVYETSIYPVVRWIQYNTFARSSINGFVLLIMIIGFYYSYLFYWLFKNRLTGIHKMKVITGLINPFIYIVILFYWCWGFHYKGSTLTSKIDLDVKTLNEKALREEVGYTLNTILSLRVEMGIDSISSITESGFDFTEQVDLNSIGAEVISQEFGLLYYGPARVRPFYPKGLLYRLNTSGFYNPITGECNYEEAMHIIQQPFVKAHEWCHAQGITDEGDANFLAYLICLHADDLTSRYSAHVVYWRYLLYDAKRNFPEFYDTARDNIPTGLKKDLVEIRAAMNAYPELMPRTRDFIYDTYLKTHGIDDGMESYNRLVKMVVAYKRAKRI